MDIEIKKFMGIAPLYSPNALPPGMAVNAVNCDLSNGNLKPVKGHKNTEFTASGNSLHYFFGNWHSGTDKYYNEIQIDNNEILIYLDDDGIPKKQVKSYVADLGQSLPGAPVIAAGSTGVLSGIYQYIVTFTRDVGGHIDESGPGTASSELTVALKTITVYRPTGFDEYVTHWNIYRISSITGEFQFVASVDIGETSYSDNNADVDLSASPTTWYTSLQGNNIIFTKPSVAFDGIAGPYAGMMFAWKYETLYWSEPGYPDSWPVYYYIQFQSEIKAVIPFAGSVTVLTRSGAYRIDGTNPELLQVTDTLGDDPCISNAACTVKGGIVYLSDSGIELFDLNSNTSITDQLFYESWFRENIDYTTAILIENDNILFLFNSKCTLFYDRGNWGYLDIIASGAWKNKEDVYVIADDGYIYQVFGNSEYLNFTWESGEIFLDTDQIFRAIATLGNGIIRLSVKIDGLVNVMKLLSLNNMYRDRILGLRPEWIGRNIQLEYSGNAEILKTSVRI